MDVQAKEKPKSGRSKRGEGGGSSSRTLGAPKRTLVQCVIYAGLQAFNSQVKIRVRQGASASVEGEREGRGRMQTQAIKGGGGVLCMS